MATKKKGDRTDLHRCFAMIVVLVLSTSMDDSLLVVRFVPTSIDVSSLLVVFFVPTSIDVSSLPVVSFAPTSIDVS